MKRTPHTQPSSCSGRLSGDGSTLASARMAAQPGPAGGNSLEKARSVERSVGVVMKATVTHTIVVMMIVMISDQCAGTAWPVLSAIWNPTATMNELAIAATSLQAFTRHQNQRSR